MVASWAADDDDGADEEDEDAPPPRPDALPLPPRPRDLLRERRFGIEDADIGGFEGATIGYL
jgi:hypothetical protein